MFHTIAAVSTPPGKGGISVIRLSGADTAAITDAFFRPAHGELLSHRSPRTAVYGRIVSPTTGETIDTGVAVLYRAPASFTGEDTAEISCHGGTAVTRAVLDCAFQAGAQPAGPGDFTRRAFVHGKLTLSEAEAVGLLIDADTESRRALAAGAAQGSVTRALSPIADNLTRVLSALYAAIDYPEEDVGDEGEREIASVLADAAESVSRLAATYRAGSAIAHGIPTVIAGVPNSGKSSLYNALLRREDAIVTDIPGTTRDVLSAQADVGGVTLLLSDTAGIRESGDAVERIGVERARAKLGEAVLVLFVADASVPLSEDCRTLLKTVRRDAQTATVWAILNKSDAGYALSAEDEAIVRESTDRQLRLSARTGEGLDDLSQAVAAWAGTDALDPTRDAILWDARQAASLSTACTLLTEAGHALAQGEALDAVCTTCELALSEIAGIDGRAVDERIIEGIFARFCVGK